MTSQCVLPGFALLALLVLSPASLPAQTSSALAAAGSAQAAPTPPPTFDIADVHPSPHSLFADGGAGVRNWPAVLKLRVKS